MPFCYQKEKKHFFYTCTSLNLSLSFFYSKKFTIKCLNFLYKVLNMHLFQQIWKVKDFILFESICFEPIIFLIMNVRKITCHVDSIFWSFSCLELKVPQNPPHSSRYKCTLLSHLSSSLISAYDWCEEILTESNCRTKEDVKSFHCWFRGLDELQVE